MENIKKELIKVEGSAWKNAIEKALQEALSKVQIDGFRKGHAPKDLFLKKYGIKSVYMDAADIVLKEEYPKLIEKNMDLEIIAEPELDIKKIDEESLEVEVIFTLKPEVKLGDYKNLDVKKEKVKVTKEEIEKTISEMQNRYAENVVKEGKVDEGNIAIIDFEGFKDGVAFNGGKGENYSLEIGSNTFIPGFEDQLIGMEKGEVKDINVTFPEDYHEESLKGQPVVFKVKVNEIKEIKLPEINEEFFSDLDIEVVNAKEELEKTVEENIKARKEMDAENNYVDNLLEALAKITEVEIPEVMIHEEGHHMVHEYEHHLQMQGITLEQFYKMTNSNEEKLVEQMHDEAEKRIKYRLILEEIVKVEKIEATQEEIDKEIKEQAKQYNVTEEEFLEHFGGNNAIKYELQMRKAIEVLKK